MEIIFTLHAKMRMLERFILEEEILEVISNPDKLEDFGKNRKKAMKTIKHKIYKVIYVIKNSKHIIITVS